MHPKPGRPSFPLVVQFDLERIRNRRLTSLAGRSSIEGPVLALLVLGVFYGVMCSLLE